MINIEALTEDEFNEYVDYALDLFHSRASDALPLNDEDAYDRLYKLDNDSDYSMEISLRNASEEDEYDPEIGDTDKVLCATVQFVAEDGSLKNDIKAVEIFFNETRDDEATLSANWFPED